MPTRSQPRPNPGTETGDEDRNGDVPVPVRGFPSGLRRGAAVWEAEFPVEGIREGVGARVEGVGAFRRRFVRRVGVDPKGLGEVRDHPSEGQGHA